MRYYILENKTPKETKNFDTWVDFTRNFDANVKLTEANGIIVSTEFIGYDYELAGPLPELFETIVSGPDIKTDSLNKKYSNWNDAINGHDEIIKNLKLV